MGREVEVGGGGLTLKKDTLSVRACPRCEENMEYNDLVDAKNFAFHKLYPKQTSWSEERENYAKFQDDMYKDPNLPSFVFSN